MSKSIFSNKSILLFSALVLLFTSCSKDDTVNPDYVGTWSVATNENGVKIKDNMAFTKDGLTVTKQKYIPTSNIWVDIIKATGTISVTGSTMAITYTGFGISEDITKPITMFTIGSSDFQSLMSDNGIPMTFNSQFSVSGNKLTIMVDINSNGNFTDQGETTVYTKQ